MTTAKKQIIAGCVLTLLFGATANAAGQKKKEEDSAYQWGRWAVLSPAAGGQPFVSPKMPAAANNIRPDEIGDTVPQILVNDTPVITPPVIDDPRDRLPPRTNDPRDRLPPRPSTS